MLRRLSSLLPAVLILFAVAAPLCSFAQQTIVVNGNPPNPAQPYPYTTIQSGIDAANDGDTVDVTPISGGAYKENVSFKGKAITVTGLLLNGQIPIVQGFMGAPSFVFQSGETSKSVLSNFNIQDGGGGTPPSYPTPPGPYAGLSGAIYISGSSPTIENNTFTQGYGLYIQNGSTPAILNNTITQSLCTSMYVSNAAPLIQGNTVSATVTLNSIAGSICDQFSGSAIRVLNGSSALTRIIGNTLENNVQSGTYSNVGYVPTGPGGGGAIQVNAPALIQNNIIRNNNSNAAWGGGIDIEGGSIFVVQNLIYNNNSNCGGGAIALPAESPNYQVAVLIANNTIVGNTSGSDTTQYCSPSAQLFDADVNVSEDLGAFRVIIVDNILSGDTNYIDVDCAPADPPNEIYQSIFDHNILYNAGGNFFGQYCVDVSAKYGNMAVKPSLNSDYSLASGSLAIDAGNNSSNQLLQELSGVSLTTDITGTTPRFIDARGNGYPIIDIGAYEYNPNAVTQIPPQPTTMLLNFTFPTDYHYILTATTKSPAGTPVGPVSFFVDGQPLISRTTNSNTAEIDSSGVATLTNFPLNAGTRALTATYPGHDGNPTFTPAIAIVDVVAIPFIPTHLDITDDVGTRAAFGSPIKFTITSTADDGSFPTPIPLTDLFDNKSTLLTTLNFTDSDTLNFPTVVPSPIGTHYIQVEYPGNLIYAPSGDTFTLDSTGSDTTTTLTCGKNTEVPVGSPITLTATVASVTATYGMPPGTVYFRQNSTNIGSSTLTNGVATFNAVAVPNTNSFVAIYQSVPGFDSSISQPCTVDSAALTLATSAPLPNGAPAFSPITFTAALAISPPPAGIYQIAIGTQQPVTMPPSANGSSATYTTSTLSQGTYDVVATFTPTGSSNAYSASLTQKVTAPIGDFTLTGPPSVTFRTESSGSATLTLTSLYAFSGTVSLTCNLPLPTTYLCSLSPTSDTLAANGTSTSTLSLQPTIRAAVTPSSNTNRIILAILFPLALLPFARRRRGLATLLSLALLTMVTTALTACGPDKFYPATPPGTYPLTVTATGTTLGGTAPVTHTLPVNMVITP